VRNVANAIRILADIEGFYGSGEMNSLYNRHIVPVKLFLLGFTNTTAALKTCGKSRAATGASNQRSAYLPRSFLTK
ncbi:MAG: hypothetical protein LBH00_02995, partial [Planctomycetaceae bacterium]|nr:hypothetical protein [Planctomycetaceae bacterium]